MSDILDIGTIVGHAIKATGLTQRGFAEALNERLNGHQITHATINYWLNGKSIPSTDFLVLMLIRYRDWRFDLALKLLVAKQPEVWGDEGIWALNKQGH